MNGKKIALLVDNVYQELEVWYPLLRFREAGAEVVTIGAVAGQTYTSKLGYPVKADMSYDDAKPGDFDGVIVSGRICSRPYPTASEGDRVRSGNRSGREAGGGDLPWTVGPVFDGFVEGQTSDELLLDKR